jgi:tetratricopeptide (TPR) repeat protein
MRPKTYSIGLYIVGLFILLEIGALIFIFWIRQEVRIETNAPAFAEQEAQFLELNDSGQAPEIPLPNLPKPEIEARLDLDLKNIPQLDIAKLNEDARKFRREGDFHLADAALKQALGIDPNNVLTLTNLAMLEEAKGDTARALAAWRNVIKAGTSAKDGSVQTTVELARERAKIIEQRFRLEEETEQRRTLLVASDRMIVVDKVLTDPDPVPDNPLELKKSFYLKKKTGEGELSASKVRIQLYFYERTTENRLVPAQISAKFASNPPDWTDENLTEVLTATYLKSTADDQERRYFGYLIRIYYDGILQDERAEPRRLLRLFPKD